MLIKFHRTSLVRHQFSIDHLEYSNFIFIPGFKKLCRNLHKIYKKLKIVHHLSTEFCIKFNAGSPAVYSLKAYRMCFIRGLIIPVDHDCNENLEWYPKDQLNRKKGKELEERFPNFEKITTTFGGYVATSLPAQPESSFFKSHCYEHTKRIGIQWTFHRIQRA